MATQKFLDQNGLQTLWTKIKQHVGSASVSYAASAGYATTASNATNAAKATNATQADKVKNSLNIVVKTAAGATSTVTFNGSAAQTATIDMSALATDAELNAAIESLGAEIDARISGVVADGTLITASTDASKKVTVGPTTKLTTAVGLAEGNVRSVTDGTTNGYIVVNTGGATAAIQVADFSSYATTSTLNTKVNGLSASIATNASEISTIKNAIAGGTHFIGISTTSITDNGTEKPTIGGKTATVAKGDIVIYDNKEFINTSDTATPLWEELGDTTAESDRITALENWKTNTVTPKFTEIDNSIAAIAATAANLANTVVRSFGGKTGTITIKTDSSTVTDGSASADGKATVDFAMSNNQLTGEVKLPKAIWTAIQSTEGTNTDTINLTSSVTGTKIKVSAGANTEAPASGGKKLSTSGQIYTYGEGIKTALNDAALGSITTSSTSTNAVNDTGSTYKKTTYTITPKDINGTAHTAATFEIESISDEFIAALV